VKTISGIGQYVPGDSALHRMDAAAKLGIVTAFTVAVFLVPVGARGFGGLVAMAVAVAIAVLVARVPPRAVLRGLRAVGLLMLFTIVVNSFAAPSATSLLVMGPLAVDGPGLAKGAFFAARIMLLVTGTSLLTLTTSPVQLASGIERSLAPLKLVRVPVGDLAMTLTIALRFIPTTAQEAEDIVTAQQARGASFDRGGPLARARAYVPVLVPLFFQLFRRADALATAMEARCYRGSEGRTRLNEEHMTAADWIAMLGVSAVLVAAGWLL
jgi:energy-coupling factor transport system permease protein